MGDKKKKKDDDKTEKEIRALLKLPENKRCINCNLLGPQYVCTTFWTFICTTCSGIQEFTHRVKSVSMAKFTEEEVSALQEGGNERARQIYFKAWDPQRHSFPDSSNLHMLRNFIKHIYVDGKYTGERNEGIPSMGLGYRVDSPQSNKVSPFTGRSKSPLHEDENERNSNETRSHQYALENSRYEGSPRNHRHIEIIDNRRRYDGPEGYPRNHRHIVIIDNRRRRDDTGSATRKDNHNIPQREPVTRSVSSDHLHRSIPPVVRPIGEILGENAPALQVGEHSKENIGRDHDASDKNQKISSSSGIESLIDFSMDSESSNVTAAPNMQQVPPSSDGGNQSSDELSSNGKTPPTTSQRNSLELLLFDLAAPSTGPVANVSIVPGTASAPSIVTGNGSSLVPPAINALQVLSPHGHVFPSMQKPSMISASDNSFSAEQSTRTIEALNSQPDASYLVHNAQQSSNLSTELLLEATSKSAKETSFKDIEQLLSTEAKSGERKELPQDIFTTSYGSAPAAIMGWQTSLPHGPGFGLQNYPNAMYAAVSPSTANANHFDLSNGMMKVQAPAFPSMEAFIGVQKPTALSRTTSLNAHSSGKTTSPLHFVSAITPESPFTLAMPSSAYMGNQSKIDVPPSRPQGIGGLSSNEVHASFLSATKRPADGQSTSNLSNSFPTMGPQPFG